MINILFLYWVVTMLIAFSYISNVGEAKQTRKPVRYMGYFIFAVFGFYYVPSLIGQALARVKNSC